MAGSFKSALLFVSAAIFLIIQLGISIAIFDDGIAALASGCFVFVMLVGAWFARSGGMMAVFRTLGSYDTGYGRVETREDTGERIMGTPCFGVCIGIMTIFVGSLFLSQLEGADAILAVAPAILAGILAIVAGIVFAIEYKGPYTARAF